MASHNFLSPGHSILDPLWCYDDNLLPNARDWLRSQAGITDEIGALFSNENNRPILLQLKNIASRKAQFDAEYPGLQSVASLAVLQSYNLSIQSEGMKKHYILATNRRLAWVFEVLGWFGGLLEALFKDLDPIFQMMGPSLQIFAQVGQGSSIDMLIASISKNDSMTSLYRKTILYFQGRGFQGLDPERDSNTLVIQNPSPEWLRVELVRDDPSSIKIYSSQFTLCIREIPLQLFLKPFLERHWCNIAQKRFSNSNKDKKRKKKIFENLINEPMRWRERMQSLPNDCGDFSIEIYNYFDQYFLRKLKIRNSKQIIEKKLNPFLDKHLKNAIDKA